MALTEGNNGGRPDRAPLSQTLWPYLRGTVMTLGSIAVTLLGLLFITFIIGRVMPIDPVLAIVGERASQDTYDSVYLQLGLDKPLMVQFFYYLWDVLHLDFGTSLLNARPVSEDIARVFPATLELATIGIIFGVVLGVPLGVLAAVRKGSWIDQVARVLALVGYSMPIFWLGLMGLLVFYGILGWVGGPGRVGIFYIDVVPSVTGLILGGFLARWELGRLQGCLQPHYPAGVTSWLLFVGLCQPDDTFIHAGAAECRVCHDGPCQRHVGMGCGVEARL